MVLMAGVATGQSVVLTDRCPTPAEGATELLCSYTVEFNEMSIGSLLSVALEIPEGISPSDGPDRDESCAARFDGTVRRDRHLVYKLKIEKPSGSVEFRFIAPQEDYESRNKPYYVEIDGRDFGAAGVEAAVPARKNKVSLFRLATGGGFTRLTDDSVDFKEVGGDDEHIFIDNDSRGRAEVLTGVLFKLHELVFVYRVDSMSVQADAATGSICYDLTQGGGRWRPSGTMEWPARSIVAINGARSSCRW